MTMVHNIDRLMTHEDRFMVHKTLGILSVLHFVYRYAYVWPTQGNLGYGSNNLFNHITIALHMLLSSSALIFQVMPKRLAKKPLIMYKEYQLHAIMFTLRSVIIYVLGLYSTKSFQWYACFVVHQIVDYITRVHGTPGNTAVRSRGNSRNLFKQTFRKFFSFYQIMALGSQLLAHEKMSDFGFNTIIAIQSSAFLMTCARKQIISWPTYIAGYSFALVVSYTYILQYYGFDFVFTCVMVFLMRMMGISKYICWTCFILVHQYDSIIWKTIGNAIFRT